jgi:hypothetical protein
MSNGGNVALALALGAGGGFLLWHLTRKGTAAPTAGDGLSAPSTAGTAQSASPPRVPGACSLKLDAGGLTADGERVDIPAAVGRCKAAGSAELAFAASGPASVYVELASALKRASVPLVVKAG